LGVLLAGLAFGWRPRRRAWEAFPRKTAGTVLALGIALAGGLGVLWPAAWTAALTAPVTRGALGLGAGDLGGDLAVLALLGVWVPVAVQALLGGLRAGPGLVAGAAVGVGGLALAEAICPARQLLGPAVDPWVGPWLVAQAAACVVVARVVLGGRPAGGAAPVTHTP